MHGVVYCHAGRGTPPNAYREKGQLVGEGMYKAIPPKRVDLGSKGILKFELVGRKQTYAMPATYVDPPTVAQLAK